MDPSSDPAWEKFLHQKLHELPELEAPRTLAPRVLAAIQAREARPWWHQSWWHWPVAARTAFVALALVAVGALGGSGWWLGENATLYSQQMRERFAPLTSFQDTLSDWSSALQSFVAGLGQPALIWIFALAGTAYLICVGVGTLCFRLASQRSERP